MHSKRKSVLNLSCAVLLTFLAIGAQAKTWNVPGNYPTIQSAISNPSVVAGDTVLVAAGTYNESLVWVGKDITVLGAGEGLSIIDGGGARRCLEADALTSAARLEGFTIRNGYADMGAGFMADSRCNLTVNHCTFTNNYAGSYGGGWYCESGSMTMSDCTFDNNSSGSAGAVYTFGGTISLVRCSLTNNSSGSSGGCMFLDGSLVNLSDCTFFNNSTGDAGAAIYNQGGNLTATGCAFISNQAPDSGGGIFIDGGHLNTTGCSFIGNSAGEGGGIFNYSGDVSTTGCLFTGNSAYLGSVIYNQNYSLVVTNCTLYGNSCPPGGGVIYAPTVNPASLVRNSIVWGNSDIMRFAGDHAIIAYSDIDGGAAVQSADISVDPLFADAAHGNFHLLPGSPCINLGSNQYVTSPPFLLDPTNTFLIDMDGNPRIVDGTVDLGAFEYMNQPPVANAGSGQMVVALHSGSPATDTATVTLDGSASSDPNGDSLSFAWDDGNGHTASAIKPIFQLAVGTYTFTLTVTDPSGLSNSATVQVTVNPAANQAPTANAGADQTVNADPTTNLGAVSLNGSGSDGDNDTLTYSWDDGSGHTAAGATPTFNLPRGSYTFTLTVSDPYGASASSTTHVRVNAAPVANNDGYTVNQNATLTVAAPGVLANDTDADNDPLTVTLVTGPAHGTLALNPDGSFTYTPAGGYFGVDSFTYQSNDGLAVSNVATVSITVIAINHPPDATDDSAVTQMNKPVTISVLNNDDDQDGDTLIVTAVTQPAHGSAVINGDGTVTYTPKIRFVGVDTFTYTISDGKGGTDTAKVTVEVDGKNHPPCAVRDTAATARNTPVTVKVLANDTDPDGDKLSVTGVTANPTHGTATLNADGSITYTPKAGFRGKDRFRYRITDGNGKYDSAWVIIQVG